MSAVFTSFTDERGILVPVELDSVDFDVRRVFTVVGGTGGTARGDHRLSCRELIVLVSGEAVVEVGPEPDGPVDRRVLSQAGESLDVAAGNWLRYTLRDDRSVILVLAAATYEARTSP